MFLNWRLCNHNSLAIILLSIVHRIGVCDIGLRSLRELGGFVSVIGTEIARFHRSGTTPSVTELLKMLHRWVASSGANSGSSLGGMSSGDLFIPIPFKS